MNKRGITILFKLMLVVVLILLALALVGPGRHFIDISRNATSPDLNQTGLDCLVVNGSVNSTLNNFQQANCIAVDLINPLFFLIMIGFAGAIVAARILLR